DWGSGYGRFSGIMDKYFGININNYDKYMMPQKNFLSGSEIANRKFSVVINSAVFEHVTQRRYLDEINSLVSDEGCLIFHTVVCEKIPKDPNWFYLLPVHCAFHTNKSMEILMGQWGYTCSIYCPTSKMWVLFKKKPKNVEAVVKLINTEFQTDFLYFKSGFVDYWK
ncbi:MAG: class I SAM-dependent methyltransferase, partial [Gallionella sp.]